MSAYYNENDPQAAQWLRNLIAAGHIAPGEVDSRSILDVQPDDLRGFSQCHFFAGIGGWSRALRLAGWSDSRPVWTGSCPCQPFSVAGKGSGTADERHLWPGWFRLIRERRPDVVFGEQVEAAIRHGWLDLVQTDLEGIGYAVGAVGLPAAGFGAPHIRQRLWFVADTARDGRANGAQVAGSCGAVSGSAAKEFGAGDCLPSGELGNAECAGLERHAGHGDDAAGRAEPVGSTAAPGELSYWSECDWLPCRDGKARPVEPGTFPLAHGVPGRVVKLRAYGNAIVPQVAAEMISAYMEVVSGN